LKWESAIDGTAISDQDAAMEMLHRRKARTSMADFIRYTWPCYDLVPPHEPWVEGVHTVPICDRIDQMFLDYEAGIPTYIIVVVPFRHGKSEIVSRRLPGYALGRHPSLEIILATYGQALTDQLSRDARTLMETPQYKAVFPESRLDPKNKGVSQWGLHRHHGKMNATAVGGAVTGRGAGLLICDDLIKNREEADSLPIRDKAWNAFTNDLSTRLAPVPMVMLIGTRWHVDDPIGRILNRNNPQHEDYDPEFPRYEVIRYQALQEDGTYLFPERYPATWYETQFAQLGPYASSALLQGEPIMRGGNMLKVDEITFSESIPENVQWVGAWDLASTEKEVAKNDPDSTVGALGAYYERDGKPWFHLRDIVTCRKEATERNELICSTARSDGPAVWQGVEGVAGYKDAYTTIAKILDGESVVYKITASSDKVVRASELEPVIASGRMVMSRDIWNARSIAQLGEFPNGTHDDIVDAIVHCYILARTRWRESRKFTGAFGKGRRR
jgi:predicted phage terminase large subunit-like protein